MRMHVRVCMCVCMHACMHVHACVYVYGGIFICDPGESIGHEGLGPLLPIILVYWP